MKLLLSDVGNGAFNKQTLRKMNNTNNNVNSGWTSRLADFFRSPLFVSALVAAITLVTFARVLSADFVMWDDDTIIYRNPNLKGLSIESLRWAFTDIDSMMRWNPLTLLGWSFTYHFWGLEPFWYHLGNWLFHGLSAALLFLILCRLLKLATFGRDRLEAGPWRITISAALGALLWSLHPLRVEPVAWATDRTYCQSVFFLFLAVLCYLGANEPGISIKRHRLGTIASVFFYVVSLLSYATVVGFCVIFVVLDVYPLRRLGHRRGWFKSIEARRVLLEKLPFIAAAVVVVLVTVSIRVSSAGIWQKPVSLAEFGLLERFMQAMYVWAYYVWRPWYPVNLAPVYTTFVQFDPLSLPFVASALAVVGCTAILVLLRRRWPLGLALGIFHLIMLLPALGLFEHPHYHVDRYSLIASIAWSILLAAWLANTRTRKLFRYIIISMSILAITVLGRLSFRQTLVWKNSVSLFEHMIQTLGEDNYRCDIHWRLGSVLAQQGETAEAIGHFQQTLQIAPNHQIALYRIAVVYFQSGRYNLALQNLYRLLQIKPNHHDANYLIGIILAQQRELDDAIKKKQNEIHEAH